MKPHLLYRDEDLDPERPLPPSAAALSQDLELQTLLVAMADGDRFLYDTARICVLTSLDDPEAIRYRQHILADCLERSDVVREMYRIAVEAIDREKRVWGGLLSRLPEPALHRAVEVLDLFVVLLKELRRVALEHGGAFRSEGFTTLFATITAELDDAYMRSVEDHLERLRFHDGVLMSAQLGEGNRGTQYVLRKRRVARRGWRERLLPRDRPSYVYQIADRDQSGFEALEELTGRGISLAATALAESTDHILNFFRLLRVELGFYIGCVNLHGHLSRIGSAVTFPEPLPRGRAMLSGEGMFDVCLSLRIGGVVVGNDVRADDRLLVMITGANRGGKSTFLRSLGLAQIMMQCGMFVAALSFQADVRSAIVTHFRREEDAALRSGKLDDELSRMSALVDQAEPDSLILLNESFASTNEREGSEIARQIVRALLETGVKVYYVTHMFDLASGFYVEERADATFLRAERQPDGQRTFRIVAGEPLPTSYGEDVYRRIFGPDPDTRLKRVEAGASDTEWRDTSV